MLLLGHLPDAHSGHAVKGHDLHFIIPPPLLTRLRERATRDGLSVAKVICQALEAWLG